MRVLIASDQDESIKALSQHLSQNRYLVDIASDHSVAFEFADCFTYNLIILNVPLPGICDTDFCQHLRQQGVPSPILVLATQDVSTAKVQTLDAGADDYLVKPFDLDELYARIRVLVRRNGAGTSSHLQWGDLSLDTSSFQASYGAFPLHLTPKEYSLLELFLHHPQQVMSQDILMEQLWSCEEPPSKEAIRTHIKGLRQKLRGAGAASDFIETVHSVGYRLKPLSPFTSSTDQVNHSSPKEKHNFYGQDLSLLAISPDGGLSQALVDSLPTIEVKHIYHLPPSLPLLLRQDANAVMLKLSGNAEITMQTLTSILKQFQTALLILVDGGSMT